MRRNGEERFRLLRGRAGSGLVAAPGKCAQAATKSKGWGSWPELRHREDRRQLRQRQRQIGCTAKRSGQQLVDAVEDEVEARPKIAGKDEGTKIN